MHLAILSFFQQYAQRGVETYVNNLLKYLKQDFQINLIDTPINPYQNTKRFLRKLYLDSTSLNIKEATKKALKKLDSNPPDLIYPLNNGWQSLLCKKFCLARKTKLILAGHSGPGWDDKFNLKLNPDVFIAFSKTQARWAKKINNKVLVKQIYHGVDLNQFKPGKSSISLKLQKPIFVCVSALSPQDRGGETAKNIDLTIRAIAKLSQGSLLLIGKGMDSTRIENFGNSLLGPNRFTRLSVSHNIINQYYCSADAFTLVSSTSESFGLVFLEALACNLPVITTDDALRREIIAGAGVFVKNPNDPKEYTQALTSALKTKWDNLPRQQAQKFDLKKSINQYINLFKSLK